jgi:hypothetical protein
MGLFKEISVIGNRDDFDDVISKLLDHVQNSHVSIAVKGKALCCIGDIAWGISGRFDKYLQDTFYALFQNDLKTDGIEVRLSTCNF